jgi:hypothetical protein
MARDPHRVEIPEECVPLPPQHAERNIGLVMFRKTPVKGTVSGARRPG